ncbi:hypothetical protein BGX29_002981 [Mortierella sp. GBA35]|nr:hypothetical protein BGX29_002981 [Mortierella sp. GBA35]
MDGSQMIAAAATKMTTTRLEDEQQDEERIGNLRDQLASIWIQTTQLLDSGSSAVPGTEYQYLKQDGQEEDDSDALLTIGGGGSSSVGSGSSSSGVLSAQSDMSDRTVFDWQAVQDHHRHQDDPKLQSYSFPSTTMPQHQQQSGRRTWTGASMATSPSRHWARQTRIWLRRYLSISTTPPTHSRHFHQHSLFVLDHSPLASVSSSTSTSTLMGEGGGGALHSWHHPYLQGH